MVPGLCKLVLLLCGSAAMDGLRDGVLDGCEALLTAQAAAEGACLPTVIQFNHWGQTLCHNADAPAALAALRKAYIPGGSTALLDALGEALHTVNTEQRYGEAERQAERVAFVILTGGATNADTQCDEDAVRIRMDMQRAVFGWEFFYLCTHPYGLTVAQRLQLPENRVALLSPNNAAIGCGLRAVSDALLCWRRGEGVPAAWATGLQATGTPVNTEGSADLRA